MKKYKEVGHVSSAYADKFLSELSDMIKDFQSKGCEVEIQYAAKGDKYSALILGYKNED
jgi:hypothetical protein